MLDDSLKQSMGSTASIHAVLLAGGEGKRLGGNRPKQFLTLAEESLLQRSVRRFRSWGFLKNLILVSHPDYIEDTEKEVGHLLIEGDRIVEGGVSRHDSSLRGLHGLGENNAKTGDFVFFHDVARPFFLHSDLDSLVKSARINGASTLAVPCSDTLVHSSKLTVESYLPRDGVWQVKTPQIASYSDLVEMEKSSLEIEPTDLCTWRLTLGKPTGIVTTKEWNMKVTHPGDLDLAKVYLSGLHFLGSDFQ
jgi:2-C-methyl-D-erythritol 4-phosphate cytidylyltransferase